MAGQARSSCMFGGALWRRRACSIQKGPHYVVGGEGLAQAAAGFNRTPGETRARPRQWSPRIECRNSLPPSCYCAVEVMIHLCYFESILNKKGVKGKS